jgi:hypothetical protein
MRRKENHMVKENKRDLRARVSLFINNPLTWETNKGTIRTTLTPSKGTCLIAQLPLINPHLLENVTIKDLGM